MSGLSEAASRIEHAISWNDVDQQIDEYGDDDDEYYEDDLEWSTGDCDDELEESACTAGPPTDDPELLEHVDGNLEDADASATQVYASASRSFQEARELLSRVKSARGYFPVVGIGAVDGFAQPSTGRNPTKSWGKGKKGKKKKKDFFVQVWKVSNPSVTWSLAKTTDLTLRISSTDVREASIRNWHNSWWTTSRSSTSS